MTNFQNILISFNEKHNPSLRHSGRILILLLLVFIQNKGLAQIKVHPSDTGPYDSHKLIKDVFLGNGIEVLDIKFEGEAFSVGYFERAKQQIDIDRGIILTTGKSSEADKANDVLFTSSYSSGNQYKDPELALALNLDPNITNVLQDIARYTIKFVPQQDSLDFSYVFASEEYPEYACSKYKDVFGFFISGPNPNGANYDGLNIALIPGTNEVVSISNVNNGDGQSTDCLPKHPEFYHDNSGSTFLTYNAFLDVFTAGIKVIPCQEYTIKIVIADVADALFDSAVFLEAKSFSTQGVNVTVDTPTPEGKIAENCDNATINFMFDKVLTEDFTLDLNILNSLEGFEMAIPGEDYNALPPQIIIPAGSDSLAIEINAIGDQVEENDEWIIIDYQKNACERDTIAIRIIDKLLPEIIVPDSLLLCYGDSVLIDATIKNSEIIPTEKSFQNIFDFAISPLQTPVYSEIIVEGINADHLGPGIIKKVCIDTAWNTKLEDFDFFLISPKGHQLELSTDNGKRTVGASPLDSLIHTCFTEDAENMIHFGNPTLGLMDPTNPNYTGDFLPEGKWSDLWADGEEAVNGTWKLMVIDDENSFVGHLEAWSLSFHSNYSINYQWTPEDEFILCDNCEDPIVFPKHNKTYNFKVSDPYGCTSEGSTFIQVNKIPIIENLDCDSVATNLIRFRWTIPQGNYQYEYQINGGAWQTILDSVHTVTNLSFNQDITFSIRVFDDDCYGDVTSITCTTLPCPGPQIQYEQIENIRCHGVEEASIQVEATGNKGPYQFELNGLHSPIGLFKNLGAGTDTIYIIDNEGCPFPFEFTIHEPDLIHAEYEIIAISCYDGNDGSIIGYPDGGTGILTSRWEDENNISFPSNQIDHLASGEYYYIVEDSEGCLMRDTILLINPEPIEINVKIQDVKCHGGNDGSISLDINGGEGAFDLAWSPAQDELNDPFEILNLKAGFYSVIIRDSLGCEKMDTFKIIEPLNPISYTAEIRDTICSGSKNGFIELDIQGVSGNFQISWSNGQSEDSIYNLEEGLYSFHIQDENECEFIDRIEIIKLEELTIQTEVNNPSCFNSKDGSIIIEKLFYGNQLVSTKDFNFTWNTQPQLFSNSIDSLTGGKEYLVQIEDKYGCKYDSSFYLTKADSLMLDVIENTGVSCFGLSDGSIFIEAEGGNAPFEYIWNKDLGNGNLKDSLSAGEYDIVLLDNKGCTEKFQLIVDSPLPLTFTSDITQILCQGNKDGSIEIQVNGGTLPYNIIWENDQIGPIVSNLSAGNISFVLFDANDCLLTDTFLIQEPIESLKHIIETKDVDCFGFANGEIYIEAFGGTPPYAFKLGDRPFQGENLFPALKAGEYMPIIMDANGCIDEAGPILIDEGNILEIDIGEDTTIQYGNSFQLNPIIFSANSFDFSYEWSSSIEGVLSCIHCVSPIVMTNFPVNIFLRVTDENNCYSEDYIKIAVKSNRFINVATAFTPGLNDINKLLGVFGQPGTRVLLFEIFNSFGQRIYTLEEFDVNNTEIGWNGMFNGQKMPQSVYSWHIKALHPDGREKIYKGHTLLIR